MCDLSLFGLFIYTVHCISGSYKVNALNSWHGDQCDQSLQRFVHKITKRLIKIYKQNWKLAKIYYSLLYKYIYIDIYICTFNKYDMKYSSDVIWLSCSLKFSKTCYS